MENTGFILFKISSIFRTEGDIIQLNSKNFLFSCIYAVNFTFKTVQNIKNFFFTYPPVTVVRGPQSVLLDPVFTFTKTTIHL